MVITKTTRIMSKIFLNGLKSFQDAEQRPLKPSESQSPGFNRNDKERMSLLLKYFAVFTLRVFLGVLVFHCTINQMIVILT